MEKDELPECHPVDQCVVKRGLDDGLWRLLCQCWAKEPEKRPSIDAAEMTVLFDLYYANLDYGR